MRDYFAAQGADRYREQDRSKQVCREMLARQAYRFADAMMRVASDEDDTAQARAKNIVL